MRCTNFSNLFLEQFYSKNKFEKLVHLVGFIIRIYHDARPSEYKILLLVSQLVKLPAFNVSRSIIRAHAVAVYPSLF
jgi:hypothetical protein